MSSCGRVIPLGRRGPGRLPPEVIARLEHKLRRRAASVLPGDHLTRGAGDGMEIAQLRVYEPGDDVRRLDPAASARTGVPHVRLQVPERAVTTWLVLDVSASMAFGTHGRLKSDVAEGVAEVVGRIGVRRGGRVAIVVAGGAQPRLLAPRPGRGALAALRRLVAEGVDADAGGRTGAAADTAGRRTGAAADTAGRRTGAPADAAGRRTGAPADAAGRRTSAAADAAGRRTGAPRDADRRTGAPGGAESPLAAALLRVARAARSTGVVVVVSDFRDEGWTAAVRAVAARHTVLGVEVCDPMEAQLPAAGLLALVDPETGRIVEADTNRPGLREAYASREAQRRADARRALRRAGADHLVLSTGGDWLRELGRGMS